MVRPADPGGEWVPTAAYLAARPNEACRADRSAPSMDEHPERLFFSLPVLSGFQGKDLAARISRTLSFYQMFKASSLLASEDAGGHRRHEPRFDPTNNHLFADKIIVLGSSQAAALDHVVTPLGGMSGAELTMNAIRGFIEFKPNEKATLGGAILERLSGSIRGAAYMFPFLYVYWMLPVVPRWLAVRLRRAPSVAVGRLAAGSIVLLRVVLFVSSCLFVLGEELEAMVGPLKAGSAVDLLTPTVALCLEAYGEATDRLRRVLDEAAKRVAGRGLCLAGAGFERGLETLGFVRARHPRSAGPTVACRAKPVAGVPEDVHAPK